MIKSLIQFDVKRAFIASLSENTHFEFLICLEARLSQFMSFLASHAEAEWGSIRAHEWAIHIKAHFSNEYHIGKNYANNATAYVAVWILKRNANARHNCFSLIPKWVELIEARRRALQVPQSFTSLSNYSKTLCRLSRLFEMPECAICWGGCRHHYVWCAMRYDEFNEYLIFIWREKEVRSFDRRLLFSLRGQFSSFIFAKRR